MRLVIQKHRDNFGLGARFYSWYFKKPTPTTHRDLAYLQLNIFWWWIGIRLQDR